MSTYHVLNAVWIGVFPMLAMAVLIAALCYLLCCLNQIKVKFQHYRKKKQLKKARKKLLKQQQQQQRIQIQHRESLEVNTNRAEFNFSKSMSSPPYAFSYSEDVDTDTNSYSFHNEIKKSPQPPPPPAFMHRNESQKEKPRFPPPFNLTRSSLRLDLSNQFKPIRNGSNISPEKTTTLTKTNSKQQATSVEQLIVEDLKESPTSAYTRLNSLARLAHAQKSTIENILTEPSPTQPLNVPLPPPPPFDIIVTPLSPSHNTANSGKLNKNVFSFADPSKVF